MAADTAIMLLLAVALAALAGVSYFVTPVYEKAVWYIIGVLSSAFTMVIGYKFGRSMPEQAAPKPADQPKPTE